MVEAIHSGVPRFTRASGPAMGGGLASFLSSAASNCSTRSRLVAQTIHSFDQPSQASPSLGFSIRVSAPLRAILVDGSSRRKDSVRQRSAASRAKVPLISSASAGSGGERQTWKLASTPLSSLVQQPGGVLPSIWKLELSHDIIGTRSPGAPMIEAV